MAQRCDARFDRRSFRDAEPEPVPPMPSCRYTSPRTIDAALDDLAAAAGDAHVIAGGIALGILMNEKLVEPSWLIDISRIEALGGIGRLPDGSLRIGALATHTEVQRSEAVAQTFPMLAEMAREIACWRIRNRGTIGGNLVLADPQGDPPAAAIALRAVLRAATRQGPRDIPATHFFTDLYTTALGEDELLHELIIPSPPAHSVAAFGKFAARQAMDYTSTVSVAVQLVRDPDEGCITGIGLGLGGVGTVPAWPRATEEVLAGRVPERDTFDRMRQVLFDEIEPIPDHLYSADYKRHAAWVIMKRTITRAFSRADTREAAGR